MKYYWRPAPKTMMFDFVVVCLVFFMAIALLETPKAAKPTAPTLGYFAVVQNTPIGNPNDVDLYVRDPQGHIAFYADQSPSGSLINLEHDVIPGSTEGDGDIKGANCDCERTIIRGIVPGEYVVDVHMYDMQTTQPEPVKVELWSLSSGAPVITKTVILVRNGAVQTAFRFTLTTSGRVTNVNYLPIDIVYTAATTG